MRGREGYQRRNWYQLRRVGRRLSEMSRGVVPGEEKGGVSAEERGGGTS